MKLVTLTVTALALFSASADAAMDLDKMQAANGLGAIASNAEDCGYKVNEQALADYYVKSGLATPEGLAFINGVMSTKMFSEKPGVSQCTLIRTTGKSLGLLTE